MGKKNWQISHWELNKTDPLDIVNVSGGGNLSFSMGRYAIYHLAVIFIILAAAPLLAVNRMDSLAGEFVNSLISERDSLARFISPENAKLADRLGIRYTGNPVKYLISNDLDSLSRHTIMDGHLDVVWNTTRLEKPFFRLNLSVPALKIERTYYFKDNYLVAAPDYFSRNWVVLEDGFFVFHITDSTLFNGYSTEKLNQFVRHTAAQLQYTAEQLELLRREKIHYFLCRNQDEIEKLTGYHARGLYYLPYDYIITTYNCHFHELVHLLVNYKLQELPLHTLPVLQEGIAVALGGRGGRDPQVILQMGAFLQQSGFLDYHELLSWQGFQQNNTSLTYPLAGLYTRFLIDTLGIPAYLDLYRRYSASPDIISGQSIPESELPSAAGWNRFIHDFLNRSRLVRLAESRESGSSPFIKEYSFEIGDDDEYYRFRVKDTLLITTNPQLRAYQSSLFTTLFPARLYHSEKYAIIADSSEISVYNLYSNILIAKYARAFALPQIKIKTINGLYCFAIKKTVFDESLPAAAFHQ